MDGVRARDPVEEDHPVGVVDLVLERDRLEVVVVSNDQGLRDLCRGMGSLVMEADYFLSEIEETRSEVMQTLQRTQSHRPASIEDGLDEATLARLKELRDKL